MAELALAIDQGTTGTTCLVVDPGLEVRGRGYAELTQHFPRPGWVEHDPAEIWASAEQSAGAALADAGVRARELAAIGIANQRETTVLWERATGRPVHGAIVWQDRRTAARCAELPDELIRERTGLVPDPYFSATKLEWLLDETGRRDGLAFGTVDSWLVWKLAGAHVTDRTNASRTMLYSLVDGDWDDELLELFRVDRALLPGLRDSGDAIGEGRLLGATVPLRGIAGDQQAALFGHGCVRPGQAKATYGTGSFVLAHDGRDVSPPPHGLLRTAAVGGTALEGAIFVAGAALQWLRDGLGLLGDVADSAALAESVVDAGGVHFVPALAGLGSPHWAPDARGLVSGLTGGTRREHLVRAALEAIAFQVRDILEAMPLDLLRVDGGATRNAFLMQFQADVLQLPVEVAAEREMTALGAAALALGITPDARGYTRYEPRITAEEAERLYAGWGEAVRRTLL